MDAPSDLRRNVGTVQNRADRGTADTEHRIRGSINAPATKKGVPHYLSPGQSVEVTEAAQQEMNVFVASTLIL